MSEQAGIKVYIMGKVEAPSMRNEKIQTSISWCISYHILFDLGSAKHRSQFFKTYILNILDIYIYIGRNVIEFCLYNYRGVSIIQLVSNGLLNIQGSAVNKSWNCDL